MESVWKNKEKTPSFPKLQGDVKTDVLIVRGGMAGILTAFMLEKAGIDYLLIEQNRICSAITQNTTAKITSQHGLIYGKLLKTYGEDYARMYWRSNEDAIENYRILCRDIPCDFEEKSNFIYSSESNEKILLELNALNSLGIPASYVKETPLPFPVAGAVEFRNQAQFNPIKFVAGISKNLNIRENTRAKEFGEGVVTTDSGVITAKNIIIATHFPIINKHGAFFIKMHQSRSYVIALENAQNVGGMYLDEADGGFSFRNYSNLLLLGGGSHRTGKPSEGWKPLEEFARKYYPDSEIKYRWAAQDCMTLDGSAYIGRYANDASGLYVATGFNKWGMTQSMVAARLICNMITKKKNRYEEIYYPSRSVLHPQLFKNIIETGKNILTFSKPRCPHLGCALKWNKYEHSWDCPCHGSRFSEDGKLLDNPSTGGFKHRS
ncbi:MAG: FAD-dependent oxidoreductase [Clostridia bacterium]|nr:FAD-dependent oxidoreductase [Clostridia bacterium]